MSSMKELSMHDQWNSGSMHVYRLLVQDYYASTMHARWQNLIYFFTGCHHQHRAFNLRFLCTNFLQTFFLAAIFSVFQPPTSTFLSFTPPLAVVFGSDSLSDKVELFYAWRSASRIRDSFSLETKKTRINICLSVCCYGNFVLGTCRQ